MSKKKVKSSKEVAVDLHQIGVEVTPIEVEERVKNISEMVLKGLAKIYPKLRIPNAELDYEARVRLLVVLQDLNTDPTDTQSIKEMIEQWLTLTRVNSFSGFHLVIHPIEKEWEPRFFKDKHDEHSISTQAKNQGYQIRGTYYV